MSRAADAAGRLRSWLPLEAPVDVEALAAGLGVNLIERYLGPGLDGMLAAPGRDTWVVTRRGLEPAARRLVVLHEVGHYLLHAGDGVYLRTVSEQWSDACEAAAEDFAVCYGIPDELLVEGLGELELTERAGLPLEACRRRLRLAGA